MKSFDTELKKYAEKINLKVSERHELRERVLSYMEYHPLKKQARVSKDLHEGIVGESFVTFNFTMLHARVVGSIFGLVLILSPFIAEKSVPGDVLYFVKTGFNEPIQGTFANSPYEKIEFETKLMERRIAEARALASTGDLTEEVKTQIAETVKGHTHAVQSGLAELRTQDADGAAIAQISFNSSLEVQSAVLGVEGDASASSIDTILTAVNEAREEVVASQEETVAPSFDGLSARIELETTRAYELFTTIKESATDEEIRDIERRLSDINRLTLEAKDTHAQDAEKGAESLATTLGLIQKLVVFMTDIDIRETVSLESLVPVVLSEAERVTLAQTEAEAIRVIHEQVTARLKTIGDVGVKEKAIEGLGSIEKFLEEAMISIGVPDIVVAENLLKEARAIADDLNMVTQHTGIGIEPEEMPVEEEAEVVGTTTDALPETASENAKNPPRQN